MSDATPRLSLPLLAAAQAQKHITHNEALIALDALVQLSALAQRPAPPATPTEGARYIVSASPSGAFAGHPHAIALRQDGAWRFFAPQEGWICWLAGEAAALVFRAGAWSDLKPRSADRLGVAASADDTNRLAVASPAALFSHAGDDMRVMINKAAAGDTASLIFQDNSSGRAEFGLSGDDDWRVKISADGATWRDALIADRTSGAVRFPNGVEHALTRKPVAQFVFTPGGDGQVSILRFDRARNPDPRQATLAARSGDLLTLTTNDADLFFHAYMRDVSYVRVWNVSKSPPQAAWIKWNPAANQLQATHAAHISGWAAGETIQLGDIAGQPGVPAGFTRGYALDISPMLQNRLGAVFPQKGLTFKCTVNGVGVRVGIAASPTTVSGSFFGGNSLSDGGINVTMHTAPTTESSPISNSNLVYVREEGAGANTIGIVGINAAGLWF